MKKLETYGFSFLFVLSMLAGCANPPAGPQKAAQPPPAGPFTLQLIFYGLIGFTPDSSGNGMTALLVTEAAHHESVVAALDNTVCTAGTADCMVPNVTADTNFRWKLKSLTPGRLRLYLNLNNASGNSAVKMDLSTDPTDPFPSNIKDTQVGLEWVPKMHNLSLGNSLDGAACLTNPACKVNATLEVPVAKPNGVGVCHFPHEELTPPLNYGLFKFVAKAGNPHSGDTRAIADAVLVEIAAQDSVQLIAVDSQNNSYDVTLKPPFGENKVTLVISNSDFTSAPDGLHDHFDHYYDIVGSKPGDPLIFRPTLSSDWPNDDAPSCEPYMERIEVVVAGSADGQHATRECDALAFGK